MSSVYFIRPIGKVGPVKIGCSVAPTVRAQTLSKRDLKLEVAAHLPGGFFMERQFHTLFLDLHVGKEWFAWTPEMGRVIEAICRGDFDPSILPAKPVRLPRKEIEYTPERRADMAFKAKRTAAWKRHWRTVSGANWTQFMAEYQPEQAA